MTDRTAVWSSANDTEDVEDVEGLEEATLLVSSDDLSSPSRPATRSKRKQLS
jgi:hypothetical protein